MLTPMAYKLFHPYWTLHTRRRWLALACIRVFTHPKPQVQPVIIAIENTVPVGVPLAVFHKISLSMQATA